MRLTTSKSGQAPKTVLIVAFNPSNGSVYGTFAHSSYGEDPEGLARSRTRLLSSLRTDLGAKGKIDTLEVPHDQLPSATIERVDPKRRTLVTCEININSLPRFSVQPTRSRPASRKPRKSRR